MLVQSVHELGWIETLGEYEGKELGSFEGSKDGTKEGNIEEFLL